MVSTTLTDNVWQYIEVTTGTAISASAITIGKANGAYTSGFTDEVKLYPFARSAAQVKVEYSMGSVASTGLVGYWKMDEASGTLSDASGNSNTGTWNGTGGSHYTTGKFSNGGGFNGTDDYVQLASNTPTGTKTITAWIKPSSVSPPRYMALFSNYLAQINTLDGCSNVLGALAHYNGLTYLCSTGVATLDQWNFVTYIFDQVNNKIIFYVNGQPAGEQSSPNFNTVANIIGAYDVGTAYQYKGSIDETRIYNRALSSKEVRDLYNWAPSPRVYLKMEDASGTSANDDSSNARTGTLNGNPIWSQGKYGKGIKLDGTGDYIQVSDF